MPLLNLGMMSLHENRARAGLVNIWARAFSGRHGPVDGPRAVPGLTIRHGGLVWPGTAARGPTVPVPYRAVPGTGPCRVGPCRPDAHI